MTSLPVLVETQTRILNRWIYPNFPAQCQLRVADDDAMHPLPAQP